MTHTPFKNVTTRSALLIFITLLTSCQSSLNTPAPLYTNVTCEGGYVHHLQGIAVDDKAIYWSFTTQLVKTDLNGKLIKKIPAIMHHGDLTVHNNKIYVAVNLGKFNNSKGNADSWVYVYNTSDLSLITKHETQQVFHGAGGIAHRNNSFYIIGGLPKDIQHNYVYQYDENFNFIKKHTIKSGHTHQGIQTAAFAHNKWYFGCYGTPKILLVTDSNFNMIGRYEFNCSLGVVGIQNNQLLIANGKCTPETKCKGHIQLALPNKTTGIKPITSPKHINP